MNIFMKLLKINHSLQKLLENKVVRCREKGRIEWWSDSPIKKVERRRRRARRRNAEHTETVEHTEIWVEKRWTIVSSAPETD